MSTKYRKQKKWAVIQVRNDDPLAQPLSFELNDQELLVHKIKRNKRRNGREIYLKLLKEIEDKKKIEEQLQQQHHLWSSSYWSPPNTTPSCDSSMHNHLLLGVHYDNLGLILGELRLTQKVCSHVKPSTLRITMRSSHKQSHLSMRHSTVTSYCWAQFRFKPFRNP